jgi:hypothetical protein
MALPGAGRFADTSRHKDWLTKAVVMRSPRA